MSRSSTLFPLALSVLAACTGAGGEATMSFDARAVNAYRAAQTPSEFAVAVVKAEVLRGPDDADPGVIFDAAAGDVPYALVDLTEDLQQVWAGALGERWFGTYTHTRVTVAAVGQVISYVDPAGIPHDQNYVELYQDVDNADGAEAGLPVGSLLRGDVLLSVDGGGLEWFQIDESRTFTGSDVRDAVTAYQDPTPGSATQLVELAEPVTIEAGGDYALDASFELTDTFEYLDLDADGAFEPLSDDHDGEMNGFEFRVLVPGVAAAVR
jgi:hypothetical protein